MVLEKERGMEYPIKVKYNNVEIFVRKMDKEEMPDDGISYYCDYDGSIYTEKELNLIKYKN